MSRKFQPPKHAFTKSLKSGSSLGDLGPIELNLPKRSFWRDRIRQIWAFYCPLCNVPRRIPYQPRPGFKHMAQVGLTAIIFMLATWSRFEWKGIVSFFPLWTIFEVVYRSRVRAALTCNQCGFDPYLYLIDVPRAREVVENHWRKKFAEKGIPYPEKNGGKPAAAQSATKPAEAAPTKSGSPEMVT